MYARARCDATACRPVLLDFVLCDGQAHMPVHGLHGLDWSVRWAGRPGLRELHMRVKRHGGLEKTNSKCTGFVPAADLSSRKIIKDELTDLLYFLMDLA